MAKQEVLLVNPRPRRRRKKAKKRAAPRSNPVRAARSNPRRRRTRSNPSGAGILRGVRLQDDLRYALWRMGGKLVAAWAVQRFGDPIDESPGGPSSTTGDRWTLKNLGIAWLSGVLASQIAVRIVGKDKAQRVYDGALDLALTKALWTEVVGRIPYGRATFGNVENGNNGMLALPAGEAHEGDTLDDGVGNRYVLTGGKWVAMQGFDGMGRLQAEGRLGEITVGDPMGRLQAEGRLGHIMPAESVGSAADDWGRRTWRGGADPYSSSYS